MVENCCNSSQILTFFQAIKNMYFATEVIGGGSKKARMYICTSVCVQKHF